MSSIFIRRPKIYVAGPMTTAAPGNPGPYLCVAQACTIAKLLWEAGWCPVIPHLNTLWEMTGQSPFCGAEWLEYDFQLLDDCQAVCRLPGDSHGGDREVERATAMEIPVYHLVDAMMDHSVFAWDHRFLPAPVETEAEWLARMELQGWQW